MSVGKFNNGSGMGREMTVGDNLADPLFVNMVILRRWLMGGRLSLGGDAGAGFRTPRSAKGLGIDTGARGPDAVIVSLLFCVGS